jgi:hypothetical protein
MSLSDSRDSLPLTVILRLLTWRAGRVRQGPISSTSFWRGLHFTVQKHLGELLHCAALFSLPRGHWVQPSASCRGSPGSTPGRGCVRFPVSQVARLRALGSDEAREGALRCTPARAAPLPACTHTSCSIISIDCGFVCARLAPRPRSTSAVFACVILAGSLFPRKNLRARSSALNPIHVA